MKIVHADGRFFSKTGHGEAEVLYRMEGNVMGIYRSFTPDEERGRGIAESLTMAAFEFARKNGFKVRPDCSYARHFLDKHEELKVFSAEK